MKVTLKRSKNKSKKWDIVFSSGKVVSFGANGYEDFTMHKDPERKKKYIARHEKNENWNKSGLETPGFWSRWLLWNKPTLEESAKDIEKRFGLIFA